MPNNEQVDVIIYRVRETGLEVFLVNPDQNNADNDALQAPDYIDVQSALMSNCIELEPVTDANGDARKAIAIEADWHEIPSLRALMYEDYRVAKEKAKQHIRNIEHGAYVAVKEAFKRIMPAQYAFLKELKEVLVEKETTKYI